MQLSENRYQNELIRGEQHNVFICAATKQNPKYLSWFYVEGLESTVEVFDTPGFRCIVAS